MFLALILIIAVFEVLNRLNGGSFLFNMRDKLDALFNKQRLDIILLQVAIIGIIAHRRDPGHHHRRHRPELRLGRRRDGDDRDELRARPRS